MMKNYDESVEKNLNINWPYISNHHYNILIIGVSGSGKINALLNLIKYEQPDNEREHLYFKDPFE